RRRQPGWRRFPRSRCRDRGCAWRRWFFWEGSHRRNDSWNLSPGHLRGGRPRCCDLEQPQNRFFPIAPNRERGVELLLGQGGTIERQEILAVGHVGRVE